MFDFSNEKVDIKCDCGKKHFVTLKQVVNRSLVKCSCGVSIQLEDEGGSVKRSVKELNAAMEKLDDSLKF
ncbi:hypothetical protein [Sediminibacterium sp.]|uniref:hypothetical protein n=1 Tax=Sediminibacterium sp. TaxID=1917865 RepID=UPI003F6FAE46